MQTVTFGCGRCGNLVTMEERLLGQEVECPHCRQLVPSPRVPVAGLPPATLSQGPDFSVPAPEDQESIFDAAIHPDDALFGASIELRVEMPARPLGVPPSQSPPASQEQTNPDNQSVQDGDGPGPRFEAGAQAVEEAARGDNNPVAPLHSSEMQGPGLEADMLAAPSGETPAGWPFDPGTPPEADTFIPPLSTDAEPASPALDLAALTARRPVRSGMSGGLFIALVLIPLISYSILATVAIVILYSRPQPEDPFERLPDLEGDYKGAKHEKQGTIFYERLKPDLALPEKLKVALGQSIQVGDVAVTPEKVELRRIKVRHAGAAVQTSANDSLVLQLLLQNTSRDVVFCPSDPYFDRRWKGPSYGGKPYTFLEIGDKRLFGGPLPWKQGQPPEARDTIEGQHFERLSPGQTMTTVVCTDPDDCVDRILREHPDHLLWRVQVRRGLVKLGEQERSATAVVGVIFAPSDIQRPKG
jgi:DNA-directed RNA polymerase subunit RPC12/RpoP